MDSRQLIDAQFIRAVEIVQSLPKTGPIQTGYEEKLTMYRFVSRLTKPTPKIHTFASCCAASISKVPSSSAHFITFGSLSESSHRRKCHDFPSRNI